MPNSFFEVLKRFAIIPLLLFVVISLVFFIMQNWVQFDSTSSFQGEGMRWMGGVTKGTLGPNSFSPISKNPIFSGFKWCINAIHGNWGDSVYFEEPIFGLIWMRFKVTFSLAVTSLFFIYILAVPMGAYMALKYGTLLERWIQIPLLTMNTMGPLIVGSFVLKMVSDMPLGSVLLSDGIRNAPEASLGFWGFLSDGTLHLLLPVFVSVFCALPNVCVTLKSYFLESLQRPHVFFAKARGVPFLGFTFRSVIRPNLNAIIQNGLTFFISYIAGSILIETLFQVNGLGRLFFQAVVHKDHQLIVGIIGWQSALFLSLRAIGDLSKVHLNSFGAETKS